MQLLEAVNATDEAREIANSMLANSPAAIFLGNIAQHHPSYADIHAIAQVIAKLAGASFGFLGEAANSVGAYLAGFIPNQGVLGSEIKQAEQGSQFNAAQMLGNNSNNAASPCQAYILMNLEPEFDAYNPRQAMKVIGNAEFIVSLSSFKGNVTNYADVILPIAPFTETSGTFVNTEGRVQNFNGVVSPLGDTRPGWKVLRVLGNLLQLEGFDYETSEQIRAQVIPAEDAITRYLDNDLKDYEANISSEEMAGLQRIGEIPIYQTDPVVRRAESLQLTHDAAPPKAWLSTTLLGQLNVSEGERVSLKQGDGEVQIEVACDDELPLNCVRVASAHPNTIALGAMFGEISVEKL